MEIFNCIKIIIRLIFWINIENNGIMDTKVQELTKHCQFGIGIALINIGKKTCRALVLR